MSQYGYLHAVGHRDVRDGRAYAVTVYYNGAPGALVIAGKLHIHASDKPPATIAPKDYYECHKASFSDWRDILEYFSAPPFCFLLELVRTEARERGIAPNW